MPQKRIQQTLLAGVIAGYLVVAGLFAIRTPDWQAPDEPAHYNYIVQIAEHGRLPVIEQGDWDQAYLDVLKATGFQQALLVDIDSIQYEDHQPPLYYLMATPVYWLTGGSLTGLRLYSVLLGLAVVLSAYGAGLLMYPKRSWVGLGAAAFVAFMPQHVAILASVNNDALAWALVGLTLLATVAYLQGYPVRYWQLGLLVGAALVTKATVYLLGPVVAGAITLRWWAQHRAALRHESHFTFPEETRRDALNPPFGLLLRRLLAFALPALALGGFWWLRNIIVYDFPDVLGLAAHDAVVIGQPRTADRIDLLGFGGYARELVSTAFQSFWGQFGWMALPMETRFYRMIQLALLAALGGLAVDVFVLRPGHRIRGDPDDAPNDDDAPVLELPEDEDEEIVRRRAAAMVNIWLVMGLVWLLAVAGFIYYNTEFQQYQGRYMFQMLIPLGLVLALGLDGWRRLAVARLELPRRARKYGPWLAPLVFFGLALLDLWQLWRVIVPNL
jgi:hypothetical protein